jgi:hypothetical protein
MNAHDKSRIVWALKCKPEDVPDTPEKLRQALDNRRSELKAAKAKKVKDG